MVIAPNKDASAEPIETQIGTHCVPVKSLGIFKNKKLRGRLKAALPRDKVELVEVVSKRVLKVKVLSRDNAIAYVKAKAFQKRCTLTPPAQEPSTADATLSPQSTFGQAEEKIQPTTAEVPVNPTTNDASETLEAPKEASAERSSPPEGPHSETQEPTEVSAQALPDPVTPTTPDQPALAPTEVQAHHSEQPGPSSQLSPQPAEERQESPPSPAETPSQDSVSEPQSGAVQASDDPSAAPIEVRPDELAGWTPPTEDDGVRDTYWTERRRRVAVRDVELGDPSLPKLLGDSLSSVIASELQARSQGRFEVMSKGDLRRLISRQEEALMMGCNDASCLMDLASLAEADNLITASVNKLGERTILTIELLDAKLQTVLRRQAIAWRGDPSGLVELARACLAWIIEGPEAGKLRGNLQVVADQDKAAVFINGKSQGETPIDLFPDLTIGLHEVRINKDGFVPFDAPVVVNPGETTLLQATLIDESTLRPWYMSWWVWSGATVLVGGATTAIVMNQGYGGSIPLCLSECERDPWYTTPTGITGIALGALTLSGSAWLAWNWDDVLASLIDSDAESLDSP